VGRRCNKSLNHRILLSEGGVRLRRSSIKRRTLLLLALLATINGVARAAGGKLVMGTVHRIVRNLIEVKEESDEIAVVVVDSSTTYIDSSTEKPAKLKDLEAGDQIVVKVVSKDGEDTAQQVKFVPAFGSRKASVHPR
jgi:hypothetical protein